MTPIGAQKSVGDHYYQNGENYYQKVSGTYPRAIRIDFFIDFIDPTATYHQITVIGSVEQARKTLMFQASGASLLWLW